MPCPPRPTDGEQDQDEEQGECLERRQGQADGAERERREQGGQAEQQQAGHEQLGPGGPEQREQRRVVPHVHVQELEHDGHHVDGRAHVPALHLLAEAGAAPLQPGRGLGPVRLGRPAAQLEQVVVAARGIRRTLRPGVLAGQRALRRHAEQEQPRGRRAQRPQRLQQTDQQQGQAHAWKGNLFIYLFKILFNLQRNSPLLTRYRMPQK